MTISASTISILDFVFLFCFAVLIAAIKSLIELIMHPMPMIIKGSDAASNGLNRTKHPSNSTSIGSTYKGHDTGMSRLETTKLANWYSPSAINTPHRIYMKMLIKNAGAITSHSPKSELPSAANGNMGRCSMCLMYEISA